MLNTERLNEMNHWWRTGNVGDIFAPKHRRALFFEIQKYIGVRQIVAIVGLRRVGKTTLLYQTIKELIENKVNPKNILYFTFDEEKEDIQEILSLYQQKILQKNIKDEKLFVFLDEVQKLNNWQDKIKIYYDLYPNIKFFVSGSASLDIILKAKENLAGRIFYFCADLLSFSEFLEFKEKHWQIKENPEIWKNELKIELNNYLLRPFPEIINADDSFAKRYVKETVIEKTIFKDLTSLFGIKEMDLVEKLIYLIATNPGVIINLDDLSKDFGRTRQTISNYLYYLECCFIVKSLTNYRGSLKTSSRKLKKYYLIHPALCLSIANPEIGRIMESLILFKTKAEHFWRQADKEVDFIVLDNKEIRPIESKYVKTIKEKDLKALLKVMEIFGVKESTVITEDCEEKKTIESKKINVIPLWKYFIL